MTERPKASEEPNTLILYAFWKSKRDPRTTEDGLQQLFRMQDAIVKFMEKVGYQDLPRLEEGRDERGKLDFSLGGRGFFFNS